jgi:hypothetical protein
MKIVNTVKKDLEDVEYGDKKKEDIDKTFFDWKNETDYADEPIKYGSEIEEMYNKKFGDNAILDKLIKQIESMH